jgi:ABC-type sugar transport system permease subunit
MNSQHAAERRFALFAVTPAALFVLAVVVIPIGASFWLSFQRTDGVSISFVGWSNYVRLFFDKTVYQVLLVNLQFLISVPLVVISSLICGVLLFERVWGWRFFRVVFFIPSVLSTVVIGLIFHSTFQYRGPVNALLGLVGQDPINFFGSAGAAVSVIILALVWAGFGYATLIVLAGLAAIDKDVYAAAELDGAGWWHKLWYITLPQLKRTLIFVSIINVIYTFTSLFGFIFVMTSGGPGYSTTTVDYLIFQKAFSSADMGQGAALAVLVFLLIGVLTILQVQLLRRSN